MPKRWEYGEQYVDNKCPSLGHSLPMLLGHYKTIYRQLIFAGIFGGFYSAARTNLFYSEYKFPTTASNL